MRAELRINSNNNYFRNFPTRSREGFLNLNLKLHEVREFV